MAVYGTEPASAFRTKWYLFGLKDVVCNVWPQSARMASLIRPVANPWSPSTQNVLEALGYEGPPFAKPMFAHAPCRTAGSSFLPCR